MSKVKAFFRTELGLFLVLAFGGAWPLQCVGSWFALRGNQMGFTVALSVSMFVPLAALLLVRRGFGHAPTGVRWKLGLKGRWKQTLGWWVASFAALPVLVGLGAVVYFAVFPHRLDLTGSYILQTLGQAAYDEMTAMGMTPILMVVLTLVQAATFAGAFNALLAVGEEAGWRGFMYPELKKLLGCGVKARIVGGAIWGAWHWPVMVLAGYEYGFGYWGEPWLGMVLFCLVCICLGTLIDLAYEKTGSIWGAAVAHGAVNAAASAPMLVLNMADPGQPTLGPAPMGIVALLPMLALTVWVLAKQAKTGCSTAEE